MTVLVRALLILVLLACAAAPVAFLARPSQQSMTDTVAPAVSPTLFLALPSASPQSAPNILARSPFSPSRSAYVRGQSSNQAAAPTTVSLMGVSKVRGEFRATLTIDGAQYRVKIGDTTPAGVVTEITDSTVSLAGATNQTLQMY